MIFIVTGMDNSGKTTYARKLADTYKLPLIKSIGPYHTKDEKHLWLLDQMARERSNPIEVIYERFLPLEEMVYGKVLRDDPIYDLDDFYMKALKELNPVIIYTRPSSKTIFDWGTRAQMAGVMERGEELLQAWDDLMWEMKARGWTVYVYDYTHETKEIEGGIFL